MTWNVFGFISKSKDMCALKDDVKPNGNEKKKQTTKYKTKIGSESS